jgi:hypothetical protein
MAKKRSVGLPVLLSNRYVHSGESEGHAVSAPVVLARASTDHDSERRYQEELLQDVIHRCPSVLPVQDFYPSVTNLISLGREIPVDLGATTGYIDNLFVTNDARLVLVETKLYRNPEATREVVAQTLQYGMAVSKMSLDDFEACLRNSAAKGDRLGRDETVVHRVTEAAAKLSDIELADDFEDRFDRSRQEGEFLLLIVADGVHSSAERLVQWMNMIVGSAPYKFGIVELGMFDLEDGSRIVVPRTLLRITEASRHVVTVKVESPTPRISYTVNSFDTPPRKGASVTSKPITDEALMAQIKSRNAPEVVEMVAKLRTLLLAVSPQTRATPSTIQYGALVKDDFIPLVSFGAEYIWFQIPIRAIRVLGAERFVICKQMINNVAAFYRPEDVFDPDKANALNPRYEILLGKVESFVKAFSEIAEIVKTSVSEAS